MGSTRVRLSDEDLDPLQSGSVLRMASPRNVAPETRLPHPALFTVSRKEVEEAEGTGRPVMFSVFDHRRTTLEQARAIVVGDSGTHAFELDVEKVLGLARILPAEAPIIQVLRDLLVPREQAELPGMDGHCGITGTHRAPGLPKKHYKNLRDELCQLAELITP